MDTARRARSRRIIHLLIFCGWLVAGGAPFTCALAQSDPKLTAHEIHLKGKEPFSFLLPEDLVISPAAEGLKRVRFMAKAPDGRIFVTTMHDLSDNSRGAVYVLDGLDEKAGTFTRLVPYLTGLRNPNSIAFYHDAHGQDWFYLALTDRLVRYKFARGDEAPKSKAEVLATYPAYGLSYKYGGWHLTRTIAFGRAGGKDLLYVTVGSSCNACDEKEEIRATLSVMDPDGKNQRIVAKGLRNAVGMRFVNGALYLTNMGADHLGDDEPDDPMFAIDAGTLEAKTDLDFGWPHCYYSGGKAKTDKGFPLRASRGECNGAPAAFSFFAAHSSPLGFEYFGEDAGEALMKGRFLVALHGGSKKELDRGYRVVSVDQHGQVQDFITGFMDHGIIRGRPCDVFKLSDNSFLLSDDNAGVIYYVHGK